METMIGSVHKIVFKAQDSDFKIFQLRRGDFTRVTVQGDFPDLMLGSQVEVHGKFKDHPKYGASFKADAFSFTHGNSIESIKIYIQSIAKWIGPDRAEAIASYFKEDLERVIEKEPERLLEVEGIGAKISDELREAWALNRETKNVKIFLQSLGLTTHRIKEIISTYGPKAQQILTENPFLLSFNGFGFSTCDSMASKLGISTESPIRYKFFILYALKECLGSGHLYLTSNHVVRYFNAYNRTVPFKFKGGKEIILEDVHGYLNDLKNEGYIYTEEDRHYELYSYLYENESAKILAKIKRSPTTCKFDKIPIDKFIDRYEAESKIKLSTAQKEALESFVNEKVMVVTGSPGTGKCLGKDTPVMLSNGKIKPVQDIAVGDFLMGDDSLPRKVLSLSRGEGPLYKVCPSKGDAYVVNKNHILSLKDIRNGKREIFDIDLQDYLKLPEYRKHHIKGFRTPVEYPYKPIPISPYLLGYWLGNGSKNAPSIYCPFEEIIDVLRSTVSPYGLFIDKSASVTKDDRRGKNVGYYITTRVKNGNNYFTKTLRNLNVFDNKHIPDIYKFNTREVRLSLLAGVLDADGSLDSSNNFDLTFKSKTLLEDTISLARSLGFSAYLTSSRKKWTSPKYGNKYTGEGTYYRTCICGNLNLIPTVAKTKKAKPRKQIKDVLNVGIKIEPCGSGDYFGFELDGNGRFLLGDFTVTHNTTVLRAFVELMQINGAQFELLTPTGISAKKLAETTHQNAYTIHRRLGYKGSSWDFNKDAKYPTQVVVVDEISMVDMEVFYRLVSALYPTTKLVFVGDHNQLPSVGPGCVLKDLINSKEIKTIMLKEIFRQESQSDIVKAATRIKDGDTDLSLFKKEKGADIWFVPSNKTEDIEKAIISLAKELKDNPAIRDGKKRFQVLSPRNNGPLSVDSLNTTLQEVLNPKSESKPEIRLPSGIIRKGDRVLIRKNNYELGVFNGDLGKVLQISPGHVLVELEDFAVSGKKNVDIPAKQAGDLLKLGYSLTVHKCCPGYSPVITDRGVSQLKDISCDDMVYSTNDTFKKVDLHGSFGFKALTRISTKTGSVVDSSEQHRYLVANVSGIEEKEAKDIQAKSDFLITSLKPIEFSDPAIFQNNQSCRHDATSINLPEFLTKDLAWLLGALTGDGCYTDRRDGIISFCSPQDVELLNEFEKIVTGFGLKACDHIRKNRPYSKYVCSVNFRRWLLDIGMGYEKAPRKTIPPLIFRASLESRFAFVAGLIDTDGSISEKIKMVRITTSSIKLASQLQLLLKTMGIISYVKAEGFKHYKVNISGSFFKIFFENVSLRCLRKDAKLKRLAPLVSYSKRNGDKIPFGRQLVSDLHALYRETLRGKYLVKGDGFNNEYGKIASSITLVRNGASVLRRCTLINFLGFLKDKGISIPTELQKKCDFAIDNYFDDVVGVCVKERKVEMYDLSVKDTPYYTNNGYLCHNSQGQEYSLVIMPFIKMHGNNMLQRNLLYTAITRAKKKVIILGQASAIQTAILNDKIQRRNTRFSGRIREWTKGQGTSLCQYFLDPADYPNVKALKQLFWLEEKP